MSRPWSLADLSSLAGKTALVTGANRGLGREIATALAAAGATVIAGCRDITRMDVAIADIRRSTPNADITAMRVDLADLASIREVAGQFKARRSEEHTSELQSLMRISYAVFCLKKKKKKKTNNIEDRHKLS